MTYSVRYKKRSDFFWKTIKSLKGDLVTQELGVPMRVFILDDESRIEVPVQDTEFWFDSRRFVSIKSSMEKESGQKIPV